MMDRRLVENFDWSILCTFFIIALLGLVSLYSALYGQIQHQPTRNPFVRQIVWLGLGLAVFFMFLTFDYQWLKKGSMGFYLLVNIGLFLVLLFAPRINGSQRWFSILGVHLQVSEFMKLALVVELASYFSSQDICVYPSWRDLAMALVITIVPVALILAEPDLGTALCLLVIAATMIFFMGIRRRYWTTGLALALLAGWPMWRYGLKDYQKNRIRILFRPDLDPTGAGYHIRQSKIALGSGRLWGKGFLHGTQNKLHFLPEKHTDFIFSVWGEEWGFVGCLLLMILFAFLIYACLRVARRSKDRFGTLLVVGMTSIIMWQVIINIGMVIGVLPVVGITLPFVSYGGSSIVILCAALGIIENVAMRRYVFRAS